LVAAGFGKSEQRCLHFLECERAEIENPEEIVKRLVEARDLIEIPGGGAEDHDTEIIHEERAEAVERLRVVDRGKEVVEIVNEKECATAFPVHFLKERIARGVFDIWASVVEQVLGEIFRIVGGMLPLAKCFEPEIGKIADAAAFFVENNREPLPGQFGIGLEGVGDGPESGGLAHTSRAYKKSVLEGFGGRIVPDDLQQGVEQLTAGSEFCEENLGRKQSRVMKGERLR
jgi:hypothetical protein